MGAPAESTVHIGSLLSRVASEIRVSAASSLEHTELTPRSYGVLANLVFNGPSSQISLSRRSGIDRTSMVALIDDLEQRGLVERQPDPSDRRANLVVATNVGATLVSTHDDALWTIERTTLQALDDAELATLRALLTKVVDQLPVDDD